MTEANSPKSGGQQTVAKVRASAAKAIETTSGTARDLARKTAEGVEANPVGVLAGGIALGAVIGTLVPRSASEEKLLAPVGKRLQQTTRGAIDAAKDTAKAEFDVLGFSRNAARDQVGKMLGGVVKTLATAGAAALLSAKAKPSGKSDAGSTDEASSENSAPEPASATS